MTARVLAPQARLAPDNHVRNNGRIIRFTADSAANARARSRRLVHVRDAALPGVTWRHVTFAHLYTLDRDLLDAERPDLVLAVLNERFHIDVQDDAGGLSARDWYERKLEQGGVMTPGAAAVYSQKLGWP